MREVGTRVLIVDDRVDVRLTLQNVLLGFPCTFEEAKDGASALEILSRKQFDVVFLDLKLPDFAGIDVLRRARSLKAHLGKVIVLTGFPEVGTREEADELGVFRFLTKNPVDREEIRRVFAEAIGDASPDSVLDRRIFRRARRRSRSSEVSVGLTGGSGRTPRPRLLILDDRREWLDAMKKTLGGDFELTLTTSAEEACRHIRKRSFDLVVVDMKLPGEESGLDVLSRMRRAVPGLRGIILSEFPDDKSRFESGRRGALDYVAKGAGLRGSTASLYETVQRILAETANSATSVFLSYERHDREKVKRLYKRLTAHGLLPWMDCESIPVARKWEPEIRKAIAETDYFVFFLSDNSIRKEGMIRKELKQALERQEGLLDESVFVIPARLEKCEVPEPLKGYQYVDLFRRDGFSKLLGALAPKG